VSQQPQQIVQKLWNYCHILRDDGLSYGDYVEQLTFLLFLKMADEQTRPPYSKPSPVPADCDWPSLLAKDGDDRADAVPVDVRDSLADTAPEHPALGCRRLLGEETRDDVQVPAIQVRSLRSFRSTTWTWGEEYKDEAA